MTLYELIEMFPTDEACRQYLVAQRWSDGVTCPRCNCERVSELKSRKQWTCLNNDCRYRFSATAGTIFHNTRIGLKKWFMAIFIILNAKKGISSLEVKRQLKISQECCWHMCHRIREAMREDHSQADLFAGIVQADDYYFGGDARPEDKGKVKRGRGSEKKTTIVGVVESATGKVRTKHVPNLKGDTIADAVGEWVDADDTELHTDMWVGYNKLGRIVNDHKTCNHDEWFVAKDGTHCNGVENAWSLFARAVMGSFHKISHKHLHRYLSEFDSRYNARCDDSGLFFNRILKQADGRRLPQRQLVS